MRHSYSVAFGEVLSKVSTSVGHGKHWRSARKRRNHVTIMPPIPEVARGGLDTNASDRAAADASMHESAIEFDVDDLKLHMQDSAASSITGAAISGTPFNLDLSTITSISDKRIIGYFDDDTDDKDPFVRWEKNAGISQDDEYDHRKSTWNERIKIIQDNPIADVEPISSLGSLRQSIDSHTQVCQRRYDSQQDELRVLRRLVNSLCERTDLIRKEMVDSRSRMKAT